MISADAKPIKIYRRGSTDGINYDRVSENHTFWSHSLSCTNPGAISCGWTSPPTIAGYSVDFLTDFVLSEIAKGNTVGTTRYNDLVLITWKYDPTTDELTIEMNDEF